MHARRRDVATAARSCALVVLTAAASWACGDDDPDESADLAPSQVSAVTAPEPPEVPLCDLDDLTFEATTDGADTMTAEVTAAVIRIGNEGPVQCEVNVFESALADPLMEPDVWLDPGGQAELLVEHVGEACAAPEAVGNLELTVNGGVTEVPVEIGSTCGLALTAIYAVEASG